MTEQDDELKELFRNNNLEDAFEPSAENWEKMASVLNVEKREKMRWLLGVNLLIIALGAGFWFYIKKPVATAPDFSSNAKPQQKKMNATIHSQESDSTVKISLDRPVRAKSGTANSNSISPEMLTDKRIPAKATSPQTYLKPGLATASQTVKINEVLPKTVPATEPKNDLSAIVNQPDTLLTSVTLPVTPTYTTGRGSALPTGQVEESKIVQVSDHEPASSPQIKSGTQEIYHHEGEKFIGDSAEKMPETLAITNPEIQPANSISDTLPDSEEDSLTVSNTIGISNKNKGFWFGKGIYFEAGSNYLSGWKTESKTEASGFNPLVGLSIYNSLGQKTGLSVGIQYTTINHLTNTSHTSTVTRLKFGEESEVTVISALNIHYLLIPLNYYYRFNINSSINAGLTVACLLDASSRIETYSTGNGYSGAPVVSKGMGYTKGFNSYDVQLCVGYTQRLYKALSLSGRIFYGLNDIKNNTIYNTAQVERAFGFGLLLKYELWKKQ